MSPGRPGPQRVVVEADGGSRGNPGPAAYGALLKDADTGELIAERGETIGVATNNVAEYRGLIAGLELAGEHAPGAAVEVRMDSKLVVEQMSGTWKVKHPAMKPLAMRANRLAPRGTTFTWVPRAENAHADRLANEALDGERDASGPLGGRAASEASSPFGQGGRAVSEASRPLGQGGRAASEASSPFGQGGRAASEASHPLGQGGRAASEASGQSRPQTAPAQKPLRGWGPPRGKPTTLVLVRHGVTDATQGKLFSGGLASSNPPLNTEGREQARATGEWLAPLSGAFDALVSSPVRRTRETAEILAELLDLGIEEEHGIAEMEFGTWDGMSFTEVHEKWPDELGSWLGDLESAPHGGESFRAVEKRVLEGRDRMMASYAGRTVVVVSHVTPIKTLVAEALGAPLEAVYRMELAPASVSVVSYFHGGPHGDQPMANLRLYNARPTEILG